MKTLLQRVCWNTRDWKLPDGNLKRDGGYAAKHGFGHEEWNFQTDDACKGFVFGYLRYHPAQKTLAKSGGKFRIAFWSRDPLSGKKYIVGYYHEAVPATKSDALELDRHFKEQGIYRRRATELMIVPHFTQAQRSAELVRSVKKGTFNFKCKVGDLELLHQKLLLPDKVNGRPVGQYFTNPTIIDGPLFNPKRQAKKSKSGNPTPSGFKGARGGTTEPLIEDSYFRESPARLRLIVPRHKKLGNLFSAWLSKAGYTKVKKEIQFVDVEYFDESSLCRAELKTCYGATTTKAIREALGQLLEYNFFGNRTKAKKWFIVLDEKPSPADLSFLGKLARLGLPLGIFWLRGIEFECCKFKK
jgi:hypothetical protein